MRVLIAGANGKIGQHLIRKMANSSHEARALVRDPDQIPLMEQLGATEAVVGDLEDDCTLALQGCDAVIFTAGSGPHTGPEKTVDVDQNAAIRLIDTAKSVGVKRFIMVSSMRVDEPEKGPEKLQHYLAAKKAADDHLRDSGLNYTIVRPGPLTLSEGTGLVEISRKLGRSGDISREDVASVLLEVLSAHNAENLTFDVLSGDLSVTDAMARV
ncbi:SDR family oxidoreductase [Marinobacter halodurans]|uniref:SDR family oxidoreductase n=1 Tax=Marinobacter halodurans TaxID=2528979 RepID=A0ABY1ZH12_9GAMM|nr:SDR family oxidoreductase [Marinobacter halodurans]TBW48128.1 SDR family oxidoreductase [Marinobacter halodurans]